jgi:regulator of protease activity HflC (stomatin/prohibitin superfamily)
VEGDKLSLLVLLGGGIVALFIGKKGVQIVPEGEVWVVERWGRFHRILTPGLKWIFPGVERIGGRYPTTTFPIPFQLEGWTRDQVGVEVKGSLFLKIENPVQFHYQLGNFEGVEKEIEGIGGEVVGKFTLQQLIEELPSFKREFLERLSSPLSQWGISPISLTLQWNLKGVE